MKNKNLIIVSSTLMGLIIAFLIYVIPYGQSVKSFDREFETFYKSSEQHLKTLNSASAINEFNVALNKFLSMPSEFSNLKNEFDKIKSEENFIKGIWIKSSTTIEKLNTLHEDIFDVYNKLPQLVSKAIKNDFKTRNERISYTLDIGELTQISSEIKLNYDTFFENLNRLLKKNEFAKEKINFSTINSDKRLINKLGDNIVKQIQTLGDKANKENHLTLSQVINIKDASKTTNDYTYWIKTAKSLINLSSDLGANKNLCLQINSKLDSELKKIKSFLKLFSNIIDAENNSNLILKDAITLMDDANDKLKNMEKFASSSDIRTVYDSWCQVENEIVRASNALDCKEGSFEFQTVWNNIVNKPRNNINKIQEEVSKHKSFVHNEYQKATQEESSLIGSTSRDVQRSFNRIVNWAKEKTQEASNSRIGKELAISAKLFILGTKAFYDLQNPNTDPLTWAMSYEGDVDQIMKETEEVMSMDGPSLTGKNTPIEDFVNTAYSSAFDK